MKETVIVSAARTPFGRFAGGLKSFKAVDLGGIAIQEAVKRAGISPEQIDYVYMGQVLQGGCGQVPSRQATRRAGLPWEVPSITVNKVCSSGLITVSMADKAIRLGEIDIAVAGGMESMSNAPYFLPGMRWGARMMDQKAKDLMVNDGLWCSFYDRHMAIHGSEVANEFGLTRESQDEWALRSQLYASEAIKAGRLKEEIVPVEIPGKKGSTIIDTDEGPRPDTTIEALAKLPPVFAKDGTVTAGNAPGVNDGAGALVLMSREKANELGLKPLATIVGHAEVSQEARYIATVPGLSTLKLLKQKGMTIDQIDLIEANEAFAAVALTSGKIAGWDSNRVNVDGGAIAYGHPIGASGARILMHLAFALRARGGGYGIACICSGAAQGDAMMIKVE
ncbi:acetyl-CoA C-acetyltransferase [Desulfotomaculum sp. 1211_IL3151]|uniref:acetyl-CoA C-acetyltransferase n=1 Tax=Desulfotomaculum sp. 1211_IL3151 TaxID=3084055 RepID=UPI002FDA36E3